MRSGINLISNSNCNHKSSLSSNYVKMYECLWTPTDWVLQITSWKANEIKNAYTLICVFDIAKFNRVVWVILINEKCIRWYMRHIRNITMSLFLFLEVQFVGLQYYLRFYYFVTYYVYLSLVTVKWIFIIWE